MKKTLIMAALCTMCMVPAANANYLVYDPKNVAETIKMVQNTEQILGQVKQGVNLTGLINTAEQSMLKKMTDELMGTDKNEGLKRIINGALNDVISGRKINAKGILTDVLNEGMMVAQKEADVQKTLDVLTGCTDMSVLTDGITKARKDNLNSYTKTRQQTEQKRKVLLEETQKVDDEIKKLMEKINDPNTSAKQIEQLIGMTNALNSQKNSIRLEIMTLADTEKSARNTYEVNDRKISESESDNRRRIEAEKFKEEGQKASGWGVKSVADLYTR